MDLNPNCNEMWVQIYPKAKRERLQLIAIKQECRNFPLKFQMMIHPGFCSQKSPTSRKTAFSGSAGFKPGAYMGVLQSSYFRRVANPSPMFGAIENGPHCLIASSSNSRVTLHKLSTSAQYLAGCLVDFYFWTKLEHSPHNVWSVWLPENKSKHKDR